MSFHQFVVNGWLHSVREPPFLDRGLAFFYAIPEQAQGWDEAYSREFPGSESNVIKRDQTEKASKDGGCHTIQVSTPWP